MPREPELRELAQPLPIPCAAIVLPSQTTSANKGCLDAEGTSGSLVTGKRRCLVPVRLKRAHSPFVGLKNLPGLISTKSTGPGTVACNSFAVPDAVHAADAGSSTFGSGEKFGSMSWFSGDLKIF